MQGRGLTCKAGCLWTKILKAEEVYLWEYKTMVDVDEAYDILSRKDIIANDCIHPSATDRRMNLRRCLQLNKNH